MNTMNNVLQMDRDSIPIQIRKDLYEPRNKEEDIGTRFSCPVEKRSGSSHMKVKMDQVPSREGQIVYTASKKFDYLFQVEAHATLPYIKVADKYSETVSICYPHNLMHNILYSGECKIDDDHIESLDSVSQDIHSQFFEKKRDIYDRMVGNIPCLEEWNTELPAMSLVGPQHYSFTRRTHVSLPLLKGSNTVNFIYKIRTKLSDLLRMRVKRKDGTYVEIKCKMQYLDIPNKVESIADPELWGRYSEITPEERNWKTSVNEKGEMFKQILYVEDIYSTRTENAVPMGNTDSIPLKTPYPVKYLFWVAEQVEKNYNFYSNYTTNKDDVYLGWNPCSKSSIKYGASDRVEELSHDHFDLSEPYNFNFPNTPRENGYNVYCYSFDPIVIASTDNAVILNKCGAVLNVTLGNTNPFVTVKDEEEYKDEDGQVIPIEALENKDEMQSNREKYIVHVRAIVLRKLEITWDRQTSKLRYVFPHDKEIKI